MVGQNVVKLDIVSHYPNLHPVFNVSLLQPYKDLSSDVSRFANVVHTNHLLPPT
jgi:hypothetical protein